MQFGELLSDCTRLNMLNTPHHPSAGVWQADDFQQLWQAVVAREIYVLSDEVYEHICFAPGGYQSTLAHDDLRQRAIAISYCGKTYHTIGWKVGYCVAAPTLSTEIRKIHQYLIFGGQYARAANSCRYTSPGASALVDIAGVLPPKAQPPLWYRRLLPAG